MSRISPDSQRRKEREKERERKEQPTKNHDDSAHCRHFIHSTEISSMAQHQQHKKLLDSSISTLLNNNFDTDSLECCKTCLKILDNLLQNPGEEKVRKIRLSNPTIQKKISNKQGGNEILMSCGFIIVKEQQFQSPQESFLVLTSENEVTKLIVQARHMLSRVCIHQLKCKVDDIPRFQNPKPKPSISTSKSNSIDGFNAFKGQRFDGQSAAVGHLLAPPKGWKSATEAQLENLEKRQAHLQDKHQVIIQERQWVAARPGESMPRALASSTTPMTSGSSDSTLIASQIQKQQLARQQEENRGFTTKAMRDLERLKKQRVYSHTLLAISFPDGCVCKGQFLPAETIEKVASSIQQDLLASPKEFELYMTPPRTKLLPQQTILELGLVPAAKIHISWKQKPTVKSVGGYLNQSLFASYVDAAMPTAISLDEEEEKKQSRKSAAAPSAKKKKSKAERQAEMLKRMIGR
jgi:hypothetical protein